jgi:hypothetical protein
VSKAFRHSAAVARIGRFNNPTRPRIAVIRRALTRSWLALKMVDVILVTSGRYTVERQYRYVGFAFLFLVPAVALGFYFPYFSLIPDFDPSITPLIHVHAIALMLLVALFVIQPLLVQFKNFTFHRILGRLTYVLVPLVAVSVIGVIIKEFDAGLAGQMTLATDLKSIYPDVASLLLSITFYLLAIKNRRSAPAHMRYMIAFALCVAPAATNRVMGYWLDFGRFASGVVSDVLVCVIYVALIFFDRRHDANYRPYVLALGLYFFYSVSAIALVHPG